MFTRVLSQTAQTNLAVLGKSGLVQDAYLAGGSALALHFGHRYSVDFDFFSKDPFDPRELSNGLQKLGSFKEDQAKGITLLGVFNQVKFSYFQYNYPLIAQTHIFSDVIIADPADIAAMKLVAIMDRGTRRDYIDLYELTKHGITIEKMFELYDKKYHAFENNKFSLIKALGYLDEAELDIMPQMITPVSWEEVKDFFAAESLRLGRKYLE